MSDEYKEVVSLTDDLPESKYSGLSDLPEVKKPVEFLFGGGNKGEFRSMILDDVIPQRKELPEWAETTEYKTIGQKIIKATGVTSEEIAGGDAYKLNTLGEAFYNIKDGLVNFFYSTPRQIASFVAAGTKTVGVAEDSSAKALRYFNNIKKDRDAEKALRDFRLGSDNEKLTNQFAYMMGNMAGLIVTAGATGSGTVAGILEGIQEGGEYLETDLTVQGERRGGFEEYKGEGLGFATTHGILSGLMGTKGIEAGFVDNLGKVVGKEALKSEIKSEVATEMLQQAEGLVAREAQNKLYGTDTDKKTALEGILEIGKAGVMAALGSATIGGVQMAANRNYMAQQLQEVFGLTKADSKALANTYLNMSADAISRNGKAMADLAPDSRVMQMAKQQLVDDGMKAEQADKVLAKIRRDVIKEQAKKGEELSANDFYKQTETPEGLVAYVRDKAGVQQVEDSVIEEEKQQIADRRAELEQQVEQKKTEEVTPEQVQETESVTTEEQKAIEPVEEKPVEQQVKEETHTPEQLELNFLNAEENAINQAMDIEVPDLPVNQDLLTKQDVEKINNKIEEIDKKVSELSEAKTLEQKVEYDTGKQLNSFVKPKVAKSKYAERVAKQTGTEGVEPTTHLVRDVKAATKAADELVETEEDVAWAALENERADTRNLLRSEIAEALKRKISKIKDPAVRKAQLRRLINDYANVATKLGQEFRALADDSLVDAIRDAVNIEHRVNEKIKKAVAKKSDKVKKVIDNLVKSDRIMSDKRFWEEIREKMECR